ncbi:MAG: transcription termination/antitermination factor NusG [Clostridia bacterium]|nr:transcription termination/antitermination factor NusG [Clostridia bacterium]
MSEISKWYVVHTYSGYENKVATNIEKIVENRKMHDLILEVKVPTEIVVENKESEDKETGERVIVKKEVERKIFPGYVMVKVAVFEDEETGDLEMTDDTWYVIRNTRGVTGFVGPESKPIPLTEAEVYAMGVEKKVVKIDYEVGDMVSIIDGAFEGIIGTVRELDVDNNTVCVVISMLGRETPVDLELDQVEKVED